MTLGDDGVEVWRDVSGYESAYQVSNLGRVRSSLSGHWQIMKPSLVGVPGNKYPAVYLYSGTKSTRKLRKIHQLVLEAFVGARPTPQHHGCHNDGNRENNKVDNLRWDTQIGNFSDKHKHGTMFYSSGSRHALSVLSEADVLLIRDRVSDGEGVCALAREYCVSAATISSIKNRNSWKHI